MSTRDPKELPRYIRDCSRRAAACIKAGDWPGFFLWRRLLAAAEREYIAQRNAA